MRTTGFAWVANQLLLAPAIDTLKPKVSQISAAWAQRTRIAATAAVVAANLNFITTISIVHFPLFRMAASGKRCPPLKNLSCGGTYLCGLGPRILTISRLWNSLP